MPRPYAGLYKSCPEMEAFRDGYFMLEDYPHALPLQHPQRPVLPRQLQGDRPPG